MSKVYETEKICAEFYKTRANKDMQKHIVRFPHNKCNASLYCSSTMPIVSIHYNCKENGFSHYNFGERTDNKEKVNSVWAGKERFIFTSLPFRRSEKSYVFEFNSEKEKPTILYESKDDYYALEEIEGKAFLYAVKNTKCNGKNNGDCLIKRKIDEFN